MKSLNILLTGDLHGKLPDKLVEEILRQQELYKNSLLLDAGDAVEAGNLGAGSTRSPILMRMNELGYDAMAMGNRESHPFRKLLARKLSAIHFPVLAANLMAKRQPAPSPIKDFIVVDLPNGLKVAIIGLSPQMTAPESWWSRVTDYVFDVPQKTAAGLANKLRKEADLVLLLSHCGLEIDRQLALIDGIDLILGGHSHEKVFEKTKGSPIVHAGFGGRYLAIIEVELGCQRTVRIKAKIKEVIKPSPRRTNN